MENAIVSLICSVLILIGSATMTMSAINSVDKVSGAWKQMDQVTQEMRRTAITGVSSQVTDNGTGLEMIVRNEGAVGIDDFERWDVILQHEDGSAIWLPHTTSAPGWTVAELLYDGGPEVFEPGTLNPGEDARLLLRLDPPVSENTTNRVIISTANGITAEFMFKG